MIPKIIHYCWFSGDPKPPAVQEYMATWEKFLPEYDLVEWNTGNFDVSCNRYVREAFEEKLYAFVADYARLYALYHHGGVYMDSDVEIVRPLDRFLEHEAFFGFEAPEYVSMGIFGSKKGYRDAAEMMKIYDRKKFRLFSGAFDTTTNVRITTEYFVGRGLQGNNQFQTIDGTAFYPQEYFSPKDYDSGEICVTENTHAIHHFSGAWKPVLEGKNEERRAGRIRHFFKQKMAGLGKS